jgi:hypothetical protein
VLLLWALDRKMNAAEQTPAQQFLVTPPPVPALILARVVKVCAWLPWWVMLAMAQPLMVFA